MSFFLLLGMAATVDDIDDFANDEPKTSIVPVSIQSIRFQNQCQILEWMRHSNTQQCRSPLEEYLPFSICIIVFGFVKSKTNFPQTIIPFETIEIKITDIVCNASIQRNINLKLASCYLRNCEYNPQKSASSLILRTKDSSCNISKNGNLKLLQCKSEESMIPLLRMFARKLQIAGMHNGSIVDYRDIKISKPKIQTISASVNLKFRILSLEAFAKQYEFIDITRFTVIYDPEISACIKIKETKENCRNVNASIFASGQINFLGSKDIASIVEFMKYWYPKLCLFQKPTEEKYSKTNMRKREVEFETLMNQAQFEESTKRLKVDLQKHFPQALSRMLFSRKS